MDFLQTLRTANTLRDLHWDPEKTITPLFRAAELAGETGELCNVIKKLEREKMGMRGSRATIDQLSEEIGDVLICLDLLAMSYGIDLATVTQRKFNASSEKLELPTRI